MSFDVRAALEAPDAVLNSVCAALDRAFGVTASQDHPSVRAVELACGATVRLLTEPALPARSRPADTVTVTVLVDVPPMTSEPTRAPHELAEQMPLRQLTRKQPASSWSHTTVTDNDAGRGACGVTDSPAGARPA